MVVGAMMEGDMYGLFHDGSKGAGKVMGKEGKGGQMR